MMKILAGAALALSLAACQGMGGGEAGGQQQSSAAYPPSQPSPARQTTSSVQTQALSPELVRNIQRSLNQRGYQAGPVDGVYGEATQQALGNFQRDQRLTASGQLDGQTLASLGVVSPSTRAATEYTPTSRRGAAAAPSRASGLSSNQVRDLQQELSSRGYDPGLVDGLWGQRTQAALRQFQQDQNLAANGRPDSQTMAALGMEGAGTQTGAVPGDDLPNVAPEPQASQLPETEAPGTLAPSERTGANEGPFETPPQSR